LRQNVWDCAYIPWQEGPCLHSMTPPQVGEG